MSSVGSLSLIPKHRAEGVLAALQYSLGQETEINDRISQLFDEALEGLNRPSPSPSPHPYQSLDWWSCGSASQGVGGRRNILEEIRRDPELVELFDTFGLPIGGEDLSAEQVERIFRKISKRVGDIYKYVYPEFPIFEHDPQEICTSSALLKQLFRSVCDQQLSLIFSSYVSFPKDASQEVKVDLIKRYLNKKGHEAARIEICDPNCSIFCLPPEFFQLTNLQHLVIAKQNDLVALPSKIESFKHITRLEICDCDALSSLPEGIGNLGTLETCTVFLEGVDPCSLEFLTRCSNLNTFSISFSHRYFTVPDWLVDLTNLSSLRIIRAHPATVSQCTFPVSLNTLSISYCELAEMPLSIFTLSNLRKLDLSGSRFEFIPSEIEALSKLRRINLFNTPVKRFPSELLALPCLDEIGLSRSWARCMASAVWRACAENEVRLINSRNEPIESPTFSFEGEKE